MATLDPAWFGYGALLALLAASFASQLAHVRIGLAIAALLALPLALAGSSQWLFLSLVMLILLASIWQASRVWLSERQIRFAPEEQELRRVHFAALGPGDARRLIDQGHWITAKRGEVLIREDQATPSLFYIADGSATICRDGADVATVAGGALIGEATVLDGTHATGTVVLASQARLWFVPAEVLRAYLAANPQIAAALHEGFARALRGKLANANARLADRQPLN